MAEMFPTRLCYDKCKRRLKSRLFIQMQIETDLVKQRWPAW